MKILFCLASGQTAQNINPLSEIKPDKVVVATTQKIKSDGKADALINEIKNSGFKVEEIFINHEASLKSLTEQFSAFIEHHIDDDLIANITGGNKLMGIALYQLFNNWGFRSFYCDIDSNQLIWLDDESAVSNIGSKIGLKQYLRAYQFQINKHLTLASIDKKQKTYTKLLYQELCKPSRYEKVCEMIGKIHAQTAQNTQTEKQLLHCRFDHEEYAFLQHLSYESQIFELSGDKIICQDKDDKKFMNGAWLEFLVADNLRGHDFRDIYLSVEISKSTQRAGSTTRQEIDVMAMRQDKLVMVECKAKKWATASEASEAIYKLSALSDIGGLNTLPIFVSLRDIQPSAKTRASEMNIKVICGKDDIINLKQKLLN